MNLLSYLPQKARHRRAKKPAAYLPAPISRPPAVASNPLPLRGDLLPRLKALRRRQWMVGVGTGLMLLLLTVTQLALWQALSDWWFDLPWIARASFLIGDLLVVGAVYHRSLHRVFNKKVSLSDTALMVERKWPKLRQSVICAVQLSEGGVHSTRGSAQLVEIVLEQARARSTGIDFLEVIPSRKFRSKWIVCGGASLAAIAIAACTWPASLALIERIFLLNVPLPTKTIVVPITRDLAVPVGSDVEMTALARGIVPSHGRVKITYATGAPQEFPIDVLPDKPATFSFTMHNVQSPFKYSFALNDGRGPEFDVIPHVPPTLTTLECEQIYPGYTGIPPRKVDSTDLSLLAGSHLHIQATSTEGLKSATILLQGVPGSIEGRIDSSGLKVEADIPIPAKDLTGFSIHLIEPSGVTSINETVYPVDIVPDNPPTVTILEPTGDRDTITLRAKPAILFDAGDDYGLTSLSIKYQKIPPMLAGQTDAPKALPVQEIKIKIKPATEGDHYEYDLNIAAQSPPWKEGDTINYWIEARDNNTATGPGITTTDKKQFGIISTEAKQAEILERLQQNASEIDDISTTQQKINDDVSEAIPQKNNPEK